jgi:CheY-like chemotaxis protein
VRAEAKQLPLEVNIDREVPQAVMGDPVKIGQILTNLVANAVKFTEQGSVTVGVRVKRQTDDHIDLDFSVADTGIGIPADRLPYIFEDFTQASYDVGATYGGSGLGLAIVRRLLALHSSRITVESDVNRGSVFRFSLGFDTVREETPAAHIGGDAAIAETRLLSGLRVLLVEDNSFDAFVVGRALESWDVRYDVSPTVRESTEKMRTGTYDAVLLNVRAADGDVRAATTAILAASSDEGRTPLVLALTPSAEEAAEIANEDSPLMDAVTKPVDPSVLYAKLAAARE